MEAFSAQDALLAVLNERPTHLYFTTQTALALGLLGSLTPTLRHYLEDTSQSDFVRQLAALGLAFSGDRGVLPQLAQILRRKTRLLSFRVSTATAIGLLLDPRPVPFLSKILWDHNHTAGMNFLLDLQDVPFF